MADAAYLAYNNNKNWFCVFFSAFGSRCLREPRARLDGCRVPKKLAAIFGARPACTWAYTRVLARDGARNTPPWDVAPVWVRCARTLSLSLSHTRAHTRARTHTPPAFFPNGWATKKKRESVDPRFFSDPIIDPLCLSSCHTSPPGTSCLFLPRVRRA